MARRLTKKQATQIRRLYQGNRWTMSELATKFECSVSTISNVINGKIHPEEPKQTKWQKFLNEAFKDCPGAVQDFMLLNAVLRSGSAKQGS